MGNSVFSVVQELNYVVEFQTKSFRTFTGATTETVRLGIDSWK